MLTKGDDDGWYVMDMDMSVGSLPNSRNGALVVAMVGVV
jgi:hypothetical protein